MAMVHLSPPTPVLVAALVDRPMTESDIPAVLAMEGPACAHPMHAWTADNYRSSLRSGYWARLRCVPETGAIVGVCVAMSGIEEMHLLNIVVDRAWHGKGLGRAMLAALYHECRQRRAACVWLEVRPTNAPARALYVREGFEQVGLRKGYYPAEAGREDALVMRRWLDEGAA